VIASLAGLVEALADDHVVVDVGGVGYLVQCSGRTLGALPRPGEPVKLLIETHVREDRIELFGFTDPAEREWFRRLQTVQGVGARVALAILGVMGADELARAVATGDRALVSRANGVGAKLAQRIVTELRDAAAEIVVAIDGDAVLGAAEGGVERDAVSALVNLGYRRSEAVSAIAAAARRAGADAGIDALIREGLKELAR